MRTDLIPATRILCSALLSGANPGRRSPCGRFATGCGRCWQCVHAAPTSWTAAHSLEIILLIRCRFQAMLAIAGVLHVHHDRCASCVPSNSLTHFHSYALQGAGDAGDARVPLVDHDWARPGHGGDEKSGGPPGGPAVAVAVPPRPAHHEAAGNRAARLAGQHLGWRSPCAETGRRHGVARFCGSEVAAVCHTGTGAGCFMRRREQALAKAVHHLVGLHSPWQWPHGRPSLQPLATSLSARSGLVASFE